MISFLILGFCVCASVRSDVSHLVFGTVDPFFGYHPVFISSTPRPNLPEIIVNSANRGGGYHYDKPENTYLTPPPPPPPAPSFPPQADTPVNGYLPASGSIPLADAPITPPPPPPNPSYLPPSTPEEISENLEDIFPQNDPAQIVVSIPTSTNGNKEGGFGYYYDRPTTTTAPQAPVFIPQADQPVNVPQSPGGYVYEPPRTPTTGYLPPQTEQRLAKGIDAFAANDKGSIQLQLNEMRCIPNQGGYFRSVLTLHSAIYAAPIVDNDIVDSRCDLRLIRTQIYVNIAAEDFQRCGVVYCGANLCLRVRFPLIRGMKTGGDSILTLQCKIQDRVVSKTHALKVGVSNE